VNTTTWVLKIVPRAQLSRRPTSAWSRPTVRCPRVGHGAENAEADKLAGTGTVRLTEQESQANVHAVL